MKGIRFAILFFIVLGWDIGPGYSQTYRTLPDSNASWVLTYRETLQVVKYYVRSFLHETKAESDTIIDSKKYIKYFEDNCSTTNGYESAKYAGAYRSLPTGQTFILGKNNKEYLLFDVSKNTGDTVFSVFAFDTITKDYIVDSTKSLQVGPHVLKALFIKPLNAPQWDSEPLIWCEGIGCLSGGLANLSCPPASVSGFYGLDCMSVSDTIFFVGGCPGDMNTYGFPYYAKTCFFPVGLNSITASREIIWEMDQEAQV
jgi:hypothetical protein